MAERNSPSEISADRVLLLTHVFDAPRQRVFEAWSQRDDVLAWWGPAGFRLSHCEMEFREGRAWRYCMRSAEGEEHWIHGVYREIVAPEKLVFTYVNEDDGNESVVTMLFKTLGEKTELRFSQATFPNVAERDGHNWGWSSSFDLLDAYLAK